MSDSAGPAPGGAVRVAIPLGKVGQPNDVAVAALYLASDVSAMVTGHSLRIDGGWTAA